MSRWSGRALPGCQCAFIAIIYTVAAAVQLGYATLASSEHPGPDSAAGDWLRGYWCHQQDWLDPRLTPSSGGMTDQMVCRKALPAAAASESSTISNMMPTTVAQPPVPHAAAQEKGTRCLSFVVLLYNGHCV